MNRSIIVILGFFCVCLSPAGCSDRPVVRQYTVDSAPGRLITSEVLRNQFPVIPFRWTVPSQWRSAENDQFSVIAWNAGPEKSPQEARITLSELPGQAGLEPQIQRWRGQIGMPEVSGEEAMKDVQPLALGDSQGSWIDLASSKETILGLIVADRDKLWIFKYRSTNDTAEQQRPLFRQFCESLRMEKSGRS